jgi:hypothetical protein
MNNTFNCLNCSKEHTNKRTNLNKYCDNKCQAEHRFITKTIPEFYAGILSNRRTLKRCVSFVAGENCLLCKNPGEHNGKPLALQLDHIDGDAGNNKPENLRLVCPNCHSQTDTYVAKNKGNGRQARGLSR